VGWCTILFGYFGGLLVENLEKLFGSDGRNNLLGLFFGVRLGACLASFLLRFFCFSGAAFFAA